MVPTWSQVGAKTAQRGPKRTPRNNKNSKTKNLGPKMGLPPNSVTSWGPSWWTKIGDFLRTCLRRRFFIDFWWFLGGLRTFIFWFSPRRKHNFHIFVKVFVGIVFDPQTLPKSTTTNCLKRVSRGSWKFTKNIFEKRCSTLRKQGTMTTPGGSLTAPLACAVFWTRNNYLSKKQEQVFISDAIFPKVCDLTRSGPRPGEFLCIVIWFFSLLLAILL